MLAPLTNGRDTETGVGRQENGLEWWQVRGGGDLVLVQVGVCDLTVLDLE